MKLLYIDLDDTLLDFTGAYNKAKKENPQQNFPQSQYGFFANLIFKDGAMKAFNELEKYFDIWFLTAPSVKNPLCYTEKRISIEKNFGYDYCKKLIICEDKSLLKGDFLIDDRAFSNKQNLFEGELIHFGSERFPNWDSVVMYLKGCK